VRNVNRLKLVPAVFVLFVAANTYAISQSVTSGKVGGWIVDPAGARVAGVVVTATSREKGTPQSVASDTFGKYEIALSPDVYDVRVDPSGFRSEIRANVQVSVGDTTQVNFRLELSQAEPLIIDVTGTLPMVQPDRTQQANTIGSVHIHELPIDRRDYLTYTLLAPGVADSQNIVDASDFRVPQAAQSGLSFYGNNGRGNSVTVDGGEANDSGGAVRPTLGQEAVQEFQINRSNYTAEMGGASGGVINIVSKSGGNAFHGSIFGFLRDQHLDATDPFAANLIGQQLERVKPPSERQQFGATLGGPLGKNRTFFFTAFEGLKRNESNSVTVLTDPSIFEPTPDQKAILAQLPVASADGLRQMLTSSERTRELFQMNSGVFPFTSSDYKFSTRVGHQFNANDQLSLRYNTAVIHETNPNAKALLGRSRAIETGRLDHTGILSWTHTLRAGLTSDVHYQFNYGDFLVSTLEKFGPEVDINGFGFFNRDGFLPSNYIWRRHELAGKFSVRLPKHSVDIGGQFQMRGNHLESEAFFPGRFTFGTLPGSLVSPQLAATSITALQAFDLGLAQSYQQGFGDPTVASDDPYTAVYLQDKWRPTDNLTLDLGLRYEVDSLRPPLPTDKNNVAPRFGFAWSPDSKTTVRGGYGIFYAPTIYALASVTTALGEINGHRPVAQVLTTIQTAGAANSTNIYQTLVREGVITLPTPTRTIAPSDIAQFGITIQHDGPRPPLTVLFKSSPDFASSYSQQMSLGFEREVLTDLRLSANYLFVRGLKILRARDENLLPAPIDPKLGIRVWDIAHFRDPLLLQDNVYESTASSFYHGMTLEVEKRLSDRYSLNANYTLSKAIDDVVDFNSDFQATDQTNLRAERALSAFDQRHKFVGLASIKEAGFTLTPVIRGVSARPFNLLAGFDLNSDRHSTTDRPAGAGRNTGIGPDFWTMDLGLTRTIRLREQARLEFISQVFNMLNHLNFHSVNNTVGNIAPPFNTKGRRDLNPSDPLGFTSAYEPRRIQLGLRLTF
jgi:hypothetical protein